MEKYWKFLGLGYVTEESDDMDNPNGIIEHKLKWRSDSKATIIIIHVAIILCIPIILYRVERIHAGFRPTIQQ